MKIPTLKRWHNQVRKTLPPNRVNRFYAVEPQEKRELYEQRMQGVLLKELSAEYGLAVGTISRLIKEMRDEQS